MDFGTCFGNSFWGASWIFKSYKDILTTFIVACDLFLSIWTCIFWANDPGKPPWLLLTKDIHSFRRGRIKRMIYCCTLHVGWIETCFFGIQWSAWRCLWNCCPSSKVSPNWGYRWRKTSCFSVWWLTSFLGPCAVVCNRPWFSLVFSRVHVSMFPCFHIMQLCWDFLLYRSVLWCLVCSRRLLASSI